MSTVNGFKNFLNTEFDRWNVEESVGTILIKVRGPVSSDMFKRLNYIRSAGVEIVFVHMGLLERLFGGNRNWKTNLVGARRIQHKRLAGLNDDYKQPTDTPWRTTGEYCPECGGRIIENRKYIECGARGCDYIQVVK